MPLDPQTLASETTASGRLQLRAEGLSLPGVASGLDGAGELAFVLERGQLHASLSGTRLQLETIAPEWDAVAALLPAPWQVELARPVGISASFRDEEILMEGSGDLALATAGPHLRAALSATLAMDPDRRVRELVVPDAEIALRDVEWADLRLDRASIRTQGAGSLEDWEGTLDLDVAGAGAPWPGLTLEAGTARAGLDVRFAAGHLSLMAREQGTLQAGALSWADDVRLDGLTVHVQPTPRRCSAQSWRMVRSHGSSTCRRACRRSRSWSRRAKRRCALPQRPRRCRSSWPAMQTVSTAAGLS